MAKPNEAIEAFSELGKTFKKLEERYGLEYFCLAIYPEFHDRLSHGEKCRPFVSKNKDLVGTSLVEYFKMEKAIAESKIRQTLETKPEK